MTVASLLVQLKQELHGERSVVHLDVFDGALFVQILEGLILGRIKIVVDTICLLGRSHSEVTRLGVLWLCLPQVACLG